MKKLLLLLAVLSFAGQAQIQFLRGDSTSRPTLSIGQPALDTNLSVNANTLWIGTAQGNRPMGGDGIRWGSLMYGTSTAGTDSFAVTIPHGPSAYSTGMSLKFKADVANTGAAYLNVNSKGWKQITRNGADALSGGEIAADEIVAVTYDGTQFQIYGSTLPDKRYVASLAFPGNTSAPTATVKLNTLGGTVVWTRSSMGVYLGTLASAFSGVVVFNGNPLREARIWYRFYDENQSQVGNYSVQIDASAVTINFANVALNDVAEMPACTFVVDITVFD